MFDGLGTVASRGSELLSLKVFDQKLNGCPCGHGRRDWHPERYIWMVSQHLLAWESRIPSQCTGPQVPFSESPWYR